MKGQVVGFSFHSNQSLDDNLARIDRFSQQGLGHAFTSLNLAPQYKSVELDLLMAACHEKGVQVMADINEASLDRYGLDRLQAWGFGSLRVDAGLTPQQMAVLSQSSQLVLNASTLTEPLLEALAQAGVDLGRVWAAHNYYPKVYSGLSQAYVLAQNQRLHALGIPCLAFVSGQVARGPYFDGLCTVEQTRHWPSQQAALYLLSQCQVDRVYIGDCDVSQDQLRRLASLNDGLVELRAQAPQALLDQVWSNRPDASNWVIRASETRQALRGQEVVGQPGPRQRGDLVLGQANYGSYANELEICLRDLPVDDRQAIVGQVASSDLGLLDYIRGDWSRFRLSLSE